MLCIGADWNLSRGDAASSVEAAYYLRTDDGVMIRVINKGVGGAARPDPASGGERFVMFTVPVRQERGVDPRLKGHLTRRAGSKSV